MLKISQVGKANHSVTLKLEGSVVGPWVGELRQVCETFLTEGPSLKLDLADVTFADADGVESKQICAMLNITENNLWVMLHRARMALRRCLETNWFEKQKVPE